MKHFLTINQLIKKHPCFTLGGMRYYIFNKKINGLEASGAILRLGRKILIDEEKFFLWIESQNAHCIKQKKLQIITRQGLKNVNP